MLTRLSWAYMSEDTFSAVMAHIVKAYCSANEEKTC